MLIAAPVITVAFVLTGAAVSTASRFQSSSLSQQQSSTTTHCFFAAMAAEDVEPSGAATAEPDVPAESTAGSTEPAAGATAGATTGESTTPAAAMPISEAVKYIGGTKAGSSTVSQQPTAHKAIDAVPVGPDPIAAGTTTRPTSAGTAGAGTTGTGFTTAGATAATAGATATGNGGAQPDEGNTDGDHFLDAALADSNMGDEESQPAHQVPASTGTTDATKTGFLAPSAAEQAAATEGGMAGGAEGGMVAGHGIAAAAAAEPTDIPSGLSADSQAVGPDPLAGTCCQIRPSRL